MTVTWELHRGSLRSRLAERRPEEVADLDLDATLTAFAAELERSLAERLPDAAVRVVACHSNHDIGREFAFDLYHVAGVTAEEKQATVQTMLQLQESLLSGSTYLRRTTKTLRYR